MMEICSDSDDQQQISKLSEDYQLASRIRKVGKNARLGLGKFKPSSKEGNGSFVFPPENEKAPLFTDRLSVPPKQWSNEAHAAPSSSHPESDEKQAAAAPEGSAATNERRRRQSLGENEQARTTRSDGELGNGGSQQSSPPRSHHEGAPQLVKVAPGASDNTRRSQVLPLTSTPLSRIPELYSVMTRKGPSSEARGADAERRSARGELQIKRPVPSERSLPGRRPDTFSATPRNSALPTHPSNGPGSIIPTGADPQGPSPVDPSLVLEADFPFELVLEMQGAAAKKANRIVIGRTLGGRASFKALHECLKLHLPSSFVSTTLLMRGYFLILFEKEEGVIATRKLTTVDWNGLSLSFSKFSPNFDANAHGSESLLTHLIKVQFPNLHEQFRNAKALIILASKLGEVLDIEAADSYIKSRLVPWLQWRCKTSPN